MATPDEDSSSKSATKPEEEEEEEDEIVGTFDVYIGQNVHNQLYLMQYPLRPSWRPYDFDQLKEVRLKKQHHTMELDFRVNSRGENYNKDRREQGKEKEDTATLTSTRTHPKTKYAIGVLNADGFHITSLPYVLQMRPDMSNCKTGSVRKVEDEQADEKQPRQVQSKHVAELLAKQQKRLFSYKKTEEAKDPWLPLNYHPAESIESASQIPFLYCNSNNSIRTGITPHRYLDAIFPPVQNDDVQADQKRYAKVPLSRMYDYNIDKRVHSLLLSAQVLSFKRVKELVDQQHKHSDKEILNCLEMCSVLVQGVWVIKAVPDYKDQIALIREYLLYQFVKSGSTVSRLTFTESIPNRTAFDKDVLLLFQDIGTLVPHTEKAGGLWNLKVPRDDAFIAEFPELVAKQTALWETRGHRIAQGLKEGNYQLTFPWSPPEAGAEGVGGAGGVAQHDPANLRKIVQKFVLDNFRKYGVCSPVALRAEYRSKKTDATNPLSLTSEDLLLRVLELTTRKFHNTLVLKKVGIPEMDKWRDLLLQVFGEQKEMKKDAIMARIQQLCSEDIPVAMFGRLVREIATPSSNRQTWTAKAGLMGKSVDV